MYNGAIGHGRHCISTVVVIENKLVTVDETDTKSTKRLHQQKSNPDCGNFWGLDQLTLCLSSSFDDPFPAPSNKIK